MVRQEDAVDLQTMLLLDEDLLMGDPKAPPETLAYEKKSELAVVGELLREPPSKPNRALLWAASHWLASQDQGVWSRTDRVWIIPGLSRDSDGVTKPLREIARAYLQAAIGADLGYDAASWRKAIVEWDGRSKHQRVD